MSWMLGLYLALSIVLAIGVFILGDDEPATVRIVTALEVAALWLPGIIMFFLLVLADEVARVIKRNRK